MKVLILTAGLGTRFLPMTKALPKAMLPILNKPVIQYLVEEALAAGCHEIIMINGRGATMIEDHFKENSDLNMELQSRGKEEGLKELSELIGKLKFTYIVQEEAKGDGHAILCAKHLIEGENFAVLFGDDIIDGDIPALKQIKSAFDALAESNSGPVISCQTSPLSEIHNYGVIEPSPDFNSKAYDSKALIPLKGLVEKPKAEDAPSNYAIIGKYICTPDTLKALEKAEIGHPGEELRLIDAFRAQIESGQKIYALEVKGARFDTGNQKGLLEANIAFGHKNALI